MIELGAVAVPAMVEGLREAGPDTRWAALCVLSQMDPKVDVPIPEIVRCLEDPDSAVRGTAAHALPRVGNTSELESVLRPLFVALKDKDRWVSDAAGLALTRIGEPALPALLAMLDDADPDTRDRAVHTLGSFMTTHIDYGASRAMKPQSRIDATRAALCAALRDRNDRVRAGAFAAFKLLGESSVPVLIAALDDPSTATRLGAVRTLGEMGHDAQASIEAIRRHRTDPDRQVRDAVEAATRAIEHSEYFETVVIPLEP